MHMWTCWASAPLSKAWMEACERLSMGENVDEQLRQLVQAYGSGVDTPVSDVYIELARVFPEAKVRIGNPAASFESTSLGDVSGWALTRRFLGDAHVRAGGSDASPGRRMAHILRQHGATSRWTVRRVGVLDPGSGLNVSRYLCDRADSPVTQCYWQRQMSMRGILPIWLAKYGSFGPHMMPERIKEAKER